MLASHAASWMLLLFVIPTILYGVSWSIYKKDTATPQETADILYYIAIVTQVLSAALVAARLRVKNM